MKPFSFKLFVSGKTARSLEVQAKIERACRELFRDDYELHVIDLLEMPDAADEYRLLATPTLIREHPTPTIRMVGSFNSRKSLIDGLNGTSQHLAA